MNRDKSLPRLSDKRKDVRCNTRSVAKPLVALHLRPPASLLAAQVGYKGLPAKRRRARASRLIVWKMAYCLHLEKLPFSSADGLHDIIFVPLVLTDDEKKKKILFIPWSRTKRLSLPRNPIT